eukprot:COSAG05_NODE_911_length_6636_cov_56.263577_4_plen_54_part_00
MTDTHVPLPSYCLIMLIIVHSYGALAEYLTEGEVDDFLLHRDEDESGDEDEDE